MGSHLQHRGGMVKWWKDEIMIWRSGDMVGWLECVNMVSRWNGAMTFLFYKWWNGETVKLFYSVMVIWWNCPTENMFWDTFPLMVKCWNGKMVNKTNIAMNCMVIFNYITGYQLGLSLLDFHPERQLSPYWRVWGSSPVLSMVSDGLSPIMFCHLSILSHEKLLMV